MEAPGLKRAPSARGENCLSCRFMEWRDSKPHCAKSDHPVMHWYFCDDWEANPDFQPVEPPSERTVRYVNRRRGEPDDVVRVRSTRETPQGVRGSTGVARWPTRDDSRG